MRYSRRTVFLLFAMLYLVRAAVLSAETSGAEFAVSVEALCIHEQYKEALLRNVVSSGGIPGGRITFGADVGRFSFSIRTGVGVGTTFVYGILPVNTYAFDADLGVLWNLPPFGCGSDMGSSWFVPAFSVGLGTGGSTNVHYYQKLNGMSFYWLTRYGLSAITALRWGKADGWRIRLEGDALLASLVSRPPERFDALETTGVDVGVIAAKLHEDVFVSPGYETGDLRLRFGVTSPPFGHFEAIAGYEGAIVFSSVPKSCALIANAVSAGVKFRWGGKKTTMETGYAKDIRE